jgi:hypothetical protein
MDHPPYSPALAPADFWLFPELKEESAESKAFLGRWGHQIICGKEIDIHSCALGTF